MADTTTEAVLRGPIAELYAAIEDATHPLRCEGPIHIDEETGEVSPYRAWQEILVEGPANTGKTLGLCIWAEQVCAVYPGVRGLFVRQTRTSLTDSVLVTWEEKVLGYGHVAIHGTASRNTRQDYIWPLATNVVDGETYTGRSTVVVRGLDKPGRALSTEWDFVIFFQGEEGFFKPFQVLKTRLRNKRWPWRPHPILLDVNPAEDDHWINERAEEGY